MHAKRGQALMELAVGMLSLALVVAALCAFARYMTRSLEIQNGLRVNRTTTSRTVEVDTLASKYVFGTDSVQIDEKAVMPSTVILR